MAKNGGYSGGHREAITPRTPSGSGNSKIVTDRYIKRDSCTGKFIDQKKDETPSKGVRKEK